MRRASPKPRPAAGDDARLRNERRQEFTSTPAYDRVIEADRRFFRRRPGRCYRVRLMARAEMEVKAAMIGLRRLDVAPGKRWFTLIRKLDNGVLYTLHAYNSADAETDLSESAAFEAFRLVSRMYRDNGCDVGTMMLEAGEGGF